MTVSIDSGSLRYVPASSTEWTELLTGTGLANPSSFWLCNESSGNLTDSGSGGRTITLSGAFTYGATATGWTRTGIKGIDMGATYGTVTIPNVNANSALLLQMFSINTVPLGGSHVLCDMETASTTTTYFTVDGKLISRIGASLITGERTQAGTLVVITKLDRSRSEFATYTQNEKLTPTWAAPGSDTTMLVLGDGATYGTDATLVYSAFWTGTDAEMSDAQVQTLLDALEADMTTRAAMAAGAPNYKVVVAIEGCEDGLLSDAPQAAVLDAWHGYDWTSVLGGLFVNIQGQQSIGRDSVFTQSGRCTLRVLDETGDDTLGKAMHRRLAGAETPITSTVDRDDTTINVKTTMNFTSSGTAYIGTECFTYTGKTATSFTGCTRGKYSPFGTAPSGSGGLRFGNHHRVGFDANNVQMQPLVTQLPRVWIGKRVSVWLHRWNESEQKLNHKREAQLAYAGRIVAIGDDPNTHCTVIELDHVTKDLANATLGRGQWKATLADGLYIPEGRVFKFTEYISGSAVGTAIILTVVAGAPVATNEMQSGDYMADEICGVWSAWLAGEKTAARISGFYNFASPVSSNVGPRTKCYWRQESGSAYVFAQWSLEMPGEVYAFLGIGNEEPGTLSQSVCWVSLQRQVDNDHREQGKLAPFHTLIFKPGSPGRLAQEFTEAISYEAQNESGTFIEQYDLLPWAVKASCDSSLPWGLFLFDEKSIVVGSLTDGVLTNCWLAPFQLTGENDAAAMRYIGRRVDEPEQGPVTLRQFICLEATWATLVKTLFYSTGTPGYNHATYDSLDYGLSAGFPGELLGDEFERSIDNMPGAQVPVVVIIDEPTKVSDLLSGDLLLRASFIRWKDGHFEIARWRTPLAVNAIATLEESNKAAPANEDRPEYRCSSILGNEFARPTVKFDYSRDFAIGRNDSYQKSFGIEDQTQVDDMGGNVPLQTIKLRNTFAGTSSTGAGLESLLADYIAVMPTFRPSLSIERSIDQRQFFELAPGDTVLVTDNYARDPISGERGITERPALVVSHSYQLGGLTPSGKDFQSGRVEVNFLDVQRGETYAPAAMIDSTASSGGFSAGYNSGTSTIRCLEHAYSNDAGVSIVRRMRRVIAEESADATYFDDGDKILIVEIDPADPASPTYWERTVASQSGNDITLTAALSAPAWDSAKKYRVVPQKWSQVQASQQSWSHQADEADHMIEDVEVAYHFAASEEQTSFAQNDGTEQGEYLPNICYGDGRPYDPAHDDGLINTINAYQDRKSAHQSPFLWNTVATAQDIDTNTLFAGPIFLGMDLLSGVVSRTLTVAPFFRSETGASASVRVTLSRVKPQTLIASTSAFPGLNSFKDPAYKDAYSQTAWWTTTSTTWQTGSDATLTVDVKDSATGIVWLVIEGKGKAECRGLAKCIEGIRTVG